MQMQGQNLQGLYMRRSASHQENDIGRWKKISSGLWRCQSLRVEMVGELIQLSCPHESDDH